MAADSHLKDVVAESVLAEPVQPPASPRVSVIVPCYKAAGYITDLLDALRAQTFRNFEIVIVNDACPDTENFERVLEPYRGEIRYIVHEVNQGVSAARNTGIRAANAPIVALMDPDDMCLPAYLELQTAVLDDDPGVDVVFANGEFFGDAWVGRLLTPVPYPGEFTFRSLLKREWNVNVGAVARREVLLRLGLYDTKLRMAEDFDLWLRLLRAGCRFRFNNVVLIRYRLRPDSLTDDKITTQRGAIDVYEKVLTFPDLPDEDGRFVKTLIARQQSMLDFFLGRQALYAGDRREALKRLTSAAKVVKGPKLRIGIWFLRLCPGLLVRLVHWRYPTEYAFLH